MKTAPPWQEGTCIQTAAPKWHSGSPCAWEPRIPCHQTPVIKYIFYFCPFHLGLIGRCWTWQVGSCSFGREMWVNFSRHSLRLLRMPAPSLADNHWGLLRTRTNEIPLMARSRWANSFSFAKGMCQCFIIGHTNANTWCKNALKVCSKYSEKTRLSFYIERVERILSNFNDDFSNIHHYQSTIRWGELAGSRVSTRGESEINYAKVQITLPTLALKLRGDLTRNSKQGYLWTPKGQNVNRP